MNEFNKSNINVSLQDLTSNILKKWWVILATAIVIASLAFGYTKNYCTPIYKTTAKILVLKTQDVDQINPNDITVATNLTKDYEELVTDHSVMEEVIEVLELNMSQESLRSKVSVYNPSNTRILEVTVSNEDPELAKNIANCICAVARDKIVELFGISQVNIMSTALVPKSPSSPNITKNVILGFALGIIISCSIIIIMFIRDDKIKSPKDIENYLGLSVLGTIPYIKKSVHSRQSEKKVFEQ